MERQEYRGNGVAHQTQFGIIRKAALYAGHGPATVDLFRNLWGDDALSKRVIPQRTEQQSSLFD